MAGREADAKSDGECGKQAEKDVAIIMLLPVVRWGRHILLRQYWRGNVGNYSLRDYLGHQLLACGARGLQRLIRFLGVATLRAASAKRGALKDFAGRYVEQ